jgi:hypothetical protein
MTKRILVYKDLKAKGIPWSPQYLRKLEERGLWPKRRYLGPRTPFWTEDEVDGRIDESEHDRGEGGK